MAILIFSGHDSFHCRQFWLKKAFDHAYTIKPFDDSATLELGVGRNMVTAIRHWGRCFGIIDEKDAPTEIGNAIFQQNGWDPFLEDQGTLWLLHYLLVTEEKASIFSLTFNELIKHKSELSAESLIKYVKGVDETNYNENTLGRDFGVFYQTYFGDFKAKDIEESFTGILSELNILNKTQRQVLDTEGKLKKRDVWVIEKTIRPEIPSHILYYGILKQHPNEVSIGFEALYSGHNSVGSVFALSRDGLTNALDRLAKDFPNELIFSNEAGIRELQIKKQREPIIVLNEYYEQHA